MLDALSPLSREAVSGHHGADGTPGVTLSNRALLGLWQVAGWDGFEAAVLPVLAKLGIKEVGDYRKAQQAKDVRTWRIAPDRVLIETDTDLSGVGSDDLAVLDLGHARTVITLSGPAARDVLMQLVAIDLGPQAFIDGEFVQTGIHHVSVLIQCTGENSFDILVPGTWAASVWHVIHENALPHGLVIEGPRHA